MSSTNQIVPKYSFPYVETVIYDHTKIDTEKTNSDDSDSKVKYVFAFTSPKGIDNVFVKKTNYDDFVNTYGKSNYRKYGQPLLEALSILDSENTNGNALISCMRVMPENATYSNSVVSLYYKVDEAEDPRNSKFRIKFIGKTVADAKSTNVLTDAETKLDGEATGGVFKDTEGFTQVPFLSVHSMGRGSYGDAYRQRISVNSLYQKEYGVTIYNFETLSTENGLHVESNIIGTIVQSSKYSNTVMLVNNQLEDLQKGSYPVDIKIIEDSVEDVYDAYIAFCKKQHEALIKKFNEVKAAEPTLEDGMYEGTVAVDDEDKKKKILEMKKLSNMIDATADSNLPDVDEFDPIYGLKANSTESLPFIFFQQEATEDAKASQDYTENSANYSAVSSGFKFVDFSAVEGVALTGGSNGYFDAPRKVENATGESVQWTVDDEINECYKNAFNGTYDAKILSPKRIAADAFFDANYDLSVKKVIADLTLTRNDALFYMDTNIISSFSEAEKNQLFSNYRMFNDRLLSKNVQHYYIKEPGTNRRVPVTITFFLAQQYCRHVINYGFHIPFVKEYAQLTGHIKDSLAPAIEDYQVDLKQELTDNRFNFFECIEENVFQRAIQNTAQTDVSDLLEESSCTVVYRLKRNIEKDIQAHLYNFSDESVRNDFRQKEIAKYADWKNKMVQTFDIRFASTQFEYERSIIHAYLDVTLRGIDKQAILEININKREYTTTTTEE